MGILGNVKLVSRTRTVPIGVDQHGNEVKVLVRAPRLQLAQELRASIKAPEPPPLKDANGKVRFKTNPRTGEPIKENGQLVPMLNLADPDYLAKAESVNKARTIAMIFECAEFPGESAVDRKAFPTELDYWLARWQELEDAGCDVGVYTLLSDACVALSEPMSADEVEDARRELGCDKETQEAAKEKLGKKAPEGK